MTEIILYDEKEANAVTLFNGDGLDPFIKGIREVAENFEGDLTTEKGRKEIKSLAYKISNAKSLVDKLRMKENERHQSEIDANNKKGKAAKTELQELQDKVRKPVTDWENADKERIEGHKNAINAIEQTSASIQSRWEIIELSEIEEFAKQLNDYKREWHEFSYKAETIIEQATQMMQKTLYRRIERDKEKAELEKLRKEEEERKQKERDDLIAKEAAEAAKRAAEQKAEAEKKAATAKAEAERLASIRREEDAEARAKDALQALKEADSRAVAEKLATALREKEALEKAKRDRQEVVERLQKQVDDQKKADAAVIAKREADKEHINKIHLEVYSDILEVTGTTPHLAGCLLDSIREGKIPHLTINY